MLQVDRIQNKGLMLQQSQIPGAGAFLVEINQWYNWFPRNQDQSITVLCLITVVLLSVTACWTAVISTWKRWLGDRTVQLLLFRFFLGKFLLFMLCPCLFFWPYSDSFSSKPLALLVVPQLACLLLFLPICQGSCSVFSCQLSCLLLPFFSLLPLCELNHFLIKFISGQQPWYYVGKPSPTSFPFPFDLSDLFCLCVKALDHCMRSSLALWAFCCFFVSDWVHPTISWFLSYTGMYSTSIWLII